MIRQVCAEKRVALTVADFAALTPVSRDLSGQRFVWRGRTYRLPLLGEHQLCNAAVALETVSALRRRGWRIDEEAVEEGLAGVCWPARMEVMSRHPVFLVDGGHNPQCAQALARSMEDLLPGRKAVFLLGVLRDKDYPAMASHLMPLARSFFCLTPLSDRALPASELAAYLTARGARATAWADPSDAIRAALDEAGEDGVVVACGSLYLVGTIRGLWDGVFRQWLRRRAIRCRDALTPAERRERSRVICRQILDFPAYRRAKTVMLYRATGGEVRLEDLEAANAAAPEPKRFVYPLCVEDRQMLAVAPGEGADAWRSGSFGIAEPVAEKGRTVPPEEIDLVICPCVSFDGHGHRLGMGGGYYDRFLPRCVNATVVAAAFEVQRSPELPVSSRDVPMERVFTERGAEPGEEKRG